MSTLTPIQAATQLLLHLDGNFVDTSARKTKSLVASSGGPGVISAGPSKFGTQAYDLAAPSTATGASWQGMQIPSWTVSRMYEGFFYVRSYGDYYLFRVDPTVEDCYIDPSGYLNVRFFDNGVINARTMRSKSAMPLNTWFHVRVVLLANRNDSTRPIRMLFVDGVLQDSNFTASVYSGTSVGIIALGHRYNSNLSSFNGRINEFLYMSTMVLDDFSRVEPPTAALPDTAGTDPQYANTLLLLHCDGANGGTTFTDSSSAARTPTAVVGSVTTSTADKVFGTASLALASGGWLEYTNSALNSLMTDDFEVEMRVKVTAIGSGNTFFTLQTSSSNTLSLRFNTGYVLGIYRNASGGANTSGGVATESAGTLSQNVWYHVRMARVGPNVFVWVDGELRACAQVTLAAGSASVFIGGTGFAGNIDEFRLTKALRAPVNFTPPTAKYSDVPNADAKLLDSPLAPIKNAGRLNSAAWKSVSPSLFLKDLNYGGKGRVSGTVKVKGSPSYAVRREVRLIRDRDGACIRATWSDPATGAYEFRYVDETQRYTILTYDYTHDKRAVVADNIQPEIM